MKVGTDGVLLGAWANGGDRILDVGTGTGLIALMMLQRFPKAHVTAIDIDEGAVRQARENILLAGCEDRIAIRQEAVQTHQGCYDAIVCNPPFFSGSLRAPDEQRSMARHDDTLSYAELMEAAWRLLAEDGELSVIVPFDYRARMADEATFRGFFPARTCGFRTVSGRPARRYLLSFKKHPCEPVRDNMTLGDDVYKSLTRAFYL